MFLRHSLLSRVTSHRFDANKAHLVADSIVFGSLAATVIPGAIAILGIALLLLLFFA